MESVLERLLRYVRIDTRSSEETHTHPSTEKQRVLADFLASELSSLSAENVRISPQCYVYAEIPPSAGRENVPALALIAHMDTSPDAPGENVRPAVIRYSGGKIPLGNSGLTLDPEVFPSLKKMEGKTLVVTDGTTLLGADDKAGIAEIMTLLDSLKSNPVPHGPLCIAFTPDEEIGEGPDFFDVDGLGAEAGYTMDGGDIDAVEYQNFNAAEAIVRITGRQVHPGGAKGIMRNASLIGMEFNEMLPPDERPETTSGFQGFFYLHKFSGTTSEAEMRYLIRDHHAVHFSARKQLLKSCADALNRKYGAESVSIEIRDQYRNMEEVIHDHYFLIEDAINALKSNGITPRISPIRGGTDGARLSFKGLPCPNLGTGGYNYHGVYEYACVEEMEKIVQILRTLISRVSSH